MKRPIPGGRRDGSVVVLVAVTMLALLGMMALSLDGGSLLSERRQAQAAADAAAMAAASDLYYNYYVYFGRDTPGTAKASALSNAAANGYPNDGLRSKITVNIPPVTGPYAGQLGFVEVLVDSYQSRGFSNVFGKDKFTIHTRAVAVGAPMAPNVGILVLNPTLKSSFNANGSGITTVSGTPVIVNSSSQEGTIAGGGGTVVAPEYDLTGNWTTTGGGTLDGRKLLDQKPTEDPLKFMPYPDPTTMTIQSNNKTQYTSGNITLFPGVYRRGISVSGTASLTLMPGIYYMDGGGFQFSGQGSLNAQGVMIFNDPKNGNADNVSISGQGSITLTAPTSGIYQGLALFQRRDSTVTASVSGTGTSTYSGTFYFAGAQLNISGNGGNVNLGSQYISDTLNIQGNGNNYIDWSPPNVAHKRTIALVE